MLEIRFEPRIDTQQVRSELVKLNEFAKHSEYYFLIYLVGMTMQELKNIERGKPTEI